MDKPGDRWTRAGWPTDQQPWLASAGTPDASRRSPESGNRGDYRGKSRSSSTEFAADLARVRGRRGSPVTGGLSAAPLASEGQLIGRHPLLRGCFIGYALVLSRSWVVGHTGRAPPPRTNGGPGHRGFAPRRGRSTPDPVRVQRVVSSAPSSVIRSSQSALLPPSCWSPRSTSG